MPSRCFFFLSALRAWSTLLSRTRTCTLAPKLMFRRIKAKAPQNGGFESGGSSRKGLKSPFGRCRQAFSSAHYPIWEQGLALAGFLPGSARPDPRDVTHLASSAGVAFAVNVRGGAGHGQPARHVIDFSADQVHHLDPLAEPGGPGQRPARYGPDVLFEL